MIIFAALLLEILVIVFDRIKLRRVMNTLDSMLDAAIGGTFSEQEFDESRLSAVESKLAQYLSASNTVSAKLSQQKMQIQEMIADISHQTKTPLANILLYTSLLEEQEQSPQCLDCIQALAVQAEKLRFLISSLIKAGRLETGVITVCPHDTQLSPLIEAVTSQVKAKANQKNITLCIDKPDGAAFLDPKWTQEALFNLLDNAVKYTPAGGKVQLSVDIYDLFCCIRVKDTGLGIPEQDLPLIFKRFYRSPTVADEQGVGLGLYLARKIANAEGGFLYAASVPGKGSTFSLCLPRVSR